MSVVKTVFLFIPWLVFSISCSGENTKNLRKISALQSASDDDSDANPAAQEPKNSLSQGVGFGKLGAYYDEDAALGPIIKATTVCKAPADPVRLDAYRRLSFLEYQNTLKHLFQFEVSLDSLGRDTSETGFKIDARQMLVNDAFLSIHISSIEKIAAEYRWNGASQCSGLEACTKAFAASVGLAIFRRPLSPEESGQLLAIAQASGLTASDPAVYGLLVKYLLLSPNFLFIDQGSSVKDQNPYQRLSMAHFLAFQTTPSLSDLQNVKKAEIPNAVTSGSGLRSQFLDQLLLLEDLKAIHKSEENYPNFNDLKGKHQADINSFLASSQTLSALFRNNGGVLALPAYNAVHSAADQKSPVKRGLLLRNRFLCQVLQEPPQNADKLEENNKEIKIRTNRDRFLAHTQVASCAGCHQYMDPLGFPNEVFAADGSKTLKENGVAIDPTGQITATLDIDQELDGVGSLADAFAEGDHVRRCLSIQMFRFLFQRVETEQDVCTIASGYEAYKASGDIDTLADSMMQSARD